jgi:hypothetical protein
MLIMSARMGCLVIPIAEKSEINDDHHRLPTPLARHCLHQSQYVPLFLSAQSSKTPQQHMLRR